MVYALVIIAVLAGIVGGLSLSNATSGVGIICGGCLFAIFARIMQASEQHAEVALLLSAHQKKTPPPDHG